MRPYIICAGAPGIGADATVAGLNDCGFDGRHVHQNVGIIWDRQRASRHSVRGGHEDKSGGDDYLFHEIFSCLKLKSVVALLRRRARARFIPSGQKYFLISFRAGSQGAVAPSPTIVNGAQ